MDTVNKYMVEGVPVDQGLELSQGSHRKVITMDFASNSPVSLVSLPPSSPLPRLLDVC